MFSNGKAPAMLGDIFAGAGGISTIGLVSSAQSLVETARAQAGQVPVATPGGGSVLASAGGIGLGLLIAFGVAYILDRKVL